MQATVWCLTHAIRTSPGGVAEPIQLVTLSGAQGSPRIHEFELDETRQAINGGRRTINAIEEYVSKFKEVKTEPPPRSGPARINAFLGHLNEPPPEVIQGTKRRARRSGDS